MSSNNPGSGFTPAMRDLQARGKNPYERKLFEIKQNYLGSRGNIAYGEGGVAHGRFTEGSSSKDSANTRQQNKTGESRDPERHYTESFEQRERRQMAMSVLDSPDLLMLIAESEGDSVAAQRQRFTRMLCGFDDAAVASATATSTSADEASGSGSARKRSSPQRRSRVSAGGGGGPA